MKNNTNSEKRVLSGIGIPVVEHCNLNCKGCLHFCYNGQSPYYYNLIELKKDLKILHKYFDFIETIRLYGGEPLLHKELEMIVKLVDEEFKETHIKILTNGILLKKMSHSLIKTLQDCNVEIVWSHYPIISEDETNNICEFLNRNGLIYSVNYVKEFYACFNVKGDSSQYDMYKRCSGKYCHVLRKGMISVCPAPMVGHYINGLGGNIDFHTSMLDLNDKNLNTEKIVNFLHRPQNICRYCSTPYYFKWEKQSSIPNLSDWIV